MSKPYQIEAPTFGKTLESRQTHVTLNGVRLPGLYGFRTESRDDGMKVVFLEIDAELFEVDQSEVKAT